MGFKSVMKKIGKVALKTAPIWMSVVPGVGTAAGIALSGAAAAADKKLSGGSWKSSLLAGGIGAGTGALMAGPGSKLLGKVGGKAAGESAGEYSSGFSGGFDGYSDVIPKLGTSATDVVRGASLGEKGLEGLSMATKGGVKGALSSTGNYFAKNPTLALAAASLLGGDDGGGQKRKNYQGPLTNPEDSLYQALAATYRAGQGMMEKKPVKLRGLLPDAPQPVSIPGLGFQIGGGMGHNPAQDDMEVDSMEGYRNYDPFQSVAPGQFAAAKKKTGL